MLKGGKPMEDIVDKLVNDILSMNAAIIRSNIKSINNLQNLPGDIATEINNLLKKLDHSIDEMSKELANDPELRKTVSDFVSAKSKKLENEGMDKAYVILDRKNRKILKPVLDRIKLLAKQNDEYTQYLYEIYETIYLSACPYDVVVVTLTKDNEPTENLER